MSKVLVAADNLYPKKTVVEWLNSVDYSDDFLYVPSDFALEFINFIKLVNGETGEEHTTPVAHLRMLDNVHGPDAKIINMCFRGMAKTTLMGEYLFLYLAVYGALPEFGKINLALYVSDSIENGVKNMRKNLEFRWENSSFLRKFIPDTNFTDIRWEFKNIDGRKFIVKGYGAKTGVRGAKEMGVRPQLAVLDDLLSDEDAKSDTIIKSIEATVNKAVNFALHPTHSKIIWSGTPFNARDPLYKAVESGAWKVNVYPICNQFPCPRDEFKGAWESRFPYSYVKAQYDFALAQGKISDFNQELMLRIMSEEDRLILDSEILWYNRSNLLANKNKFNFYITTDFATSGKQAADYSVVAVWALNYKGHWFLVDGVCKRQTMDKNIEALFMFAQRYNPQQVGIEISGQQGGFIPWIQAQMMDRNCYFNLASDVDSNDLGIRPNTNKMVRFNLVVPWFKAHLMFFPTEMKETPLVEEFVSELQLASPAGFKSKNDDCLDATSMLASLRTWRPSEEVNLVQKKNSDMWEIDEETVDESGLSSYLV
jgi:predicted phage terminase large subunit-like protein